MYFPSLLLVTSLEGADGRITKHMFHHSSIMYWYSIRQVERGGAGRGTVRQTGSKRERQLKVMERKLKKACYSLCVPGPKWALLICMRIQSNFSSLITCRSDRVQQDANGLDAAATLAAAGCKTLQALCRWSRTDLHLCKCHSAQRALQESQNILFQDDQILFFLTI